MDPNEDSLQMLIGMGFSDLTEIKRALSLSKNDLNEAVAILTNEQPGLSYDTVDEVVEMKDRGGSGKSKGDRPDQVRFSDPAPPSYDEAVEPDEVRCLLTFIQMTCSQKSKCCRRMHAVSDLSLSVTSRPGITSRPRQRT